jgi:hypothetical protein
MCGQVASGRQAVCFLALLAVNEAFVYPAPIITRVAALFQEHQLPTRTARGEVALHRPRVTAKQGKQGKQGQQGKEGKQGSRVSRVSKVNKVSRVSRGKRVSRVIRVSKVSRVKA